MLIGLNSTSAVRGFVNAADLAASATGIAARTAIAGERADGKASPFAALRECFFALNGARFLFQSCPALHRRTPNAQGQSRTDTTRACQKMALDPEARGLTLFDKSVSFDELPLKIMERVCSGAAQSARHILRLWRHGQEAFRGARPRSAAAGEKACKKIGEGRMTSETQKSDPPYVAYQWWEALNGKWEGTRQTGEDRAALARLRRASPDEAMCEEATLRLFRALGYKSPDYLLRVATLAADARDNSRRRRRRRRFGRQIGREKIEDDQTARLKIGRFKRLLERANRRRNRDGLPPRHSHSGRRCKCAGSRQICAVLR